MIKFNHVAQFYVDNKGATVRVGRRVVVVGSHLTESRGGSWERGFRFYESYWGKLTSKDGQVSLDGGRSWHSSSRAAFKTSKGKVRLSSSNHGELAFDDIQKIARDWDGPGYVWKR